MTPTIHKITLRTAALACALLATGVASAADVNVYLQAQPGTRTLPNNGTPYTAQVWKFVCDPAQTANNPSCDYSSPVLRINAAPGDNLTISLQNTLNTPVSIVIPGQAGGGDPQTITDERSRSRARSLTHETAAGQTGTYSWSSIAAGTYLVHSGTEPSIQVAMGLHGALVVGPGSAACAATATAAYGNAGSCYDSDVVLLFSEIDPLQNKRVADAAAVASVNAAHQANPTACVSLAKYNDDPVNNVGYPCTVDYNPVYFLVNGAPYDNHVANAPLTIEPGKVLLRMLNAGLRSHSPAIVGLDMGQVAEDGNAYPGIVRQQSESLMPAGKTLDALVTIANNRTYKLFDRFAAPNHEELLAGGIVAELMAGTGSTAPGYTNLAVNDAYNVGEDQTLTVLPTNGVRKNDLQSLAPGQLNVNLAVASGPVNGTLNPGCNANNSNLLCNNGAFIYKPNPNFSGTDSFTYRATLNSGVTYTALVTITVGAVNDAPVANVDSYSNTIGTTIVVDAAHGVLGNDSDADGDAMVALLASGPDSGTLALSSNGSFTYSGGTPGTHTFSYRALDNATGASSATAVTLVISPPSGIALNVQDPSGVAVPSYRWLVQEDRMFEINPGLPPSVGDTISTRFHKSYMPVVAQGCVGAADCQQGYANIPVASFGEVVLDPAKRYYVSVLPNDAGTDAGHSIGGAQVLPSALPPDARSVTVVVNNGPIPTAQISVIAFEDNSPTNGVPDAGEVGLGGFQIKLEDAGGRYGMSGGLMSQDAFGNKLKNSLDCFGSAPPLDGVILTCPDTPDNQTRGIVGTALIKDLPPGKFGVVITPPAGGPTWTQTSTIEGTKLNDNWVKAGEAPFLVENGAVGYHTFLGFVNPERLNNPGGNNTISGEVTMVHTARAPDITAYDSGSYNALSHTRPWVGLNSDAGGGPNLKTVQADLNEDADGNLHATFSLAGIPDGTHQLVIWDENLDQIISYQTVTVPDTTGGTPNRSVNVGHVPVPTWFGRQEHTVFLDDGCASTTGLVADTAEDGIRQDCEQGLPDKVVNLRFRDGTVEQSFPTDTTGFVPFDQVFPYGNWQVAEIDYSRFKPTGLTVTVDAGGRVDPNDPLTTTNYPGLLNDAYGSQTETDPAPVLLEGFQSMPGMTSLFAWGKVPYKRGENGGISGIVYYASTRGENDPRLTVGDPWEPGIPGVKVRLYRSTATGGLALVKEVETDSWDAGTPEGCQGEPASGDPFVDSTLAGDRARCFDGIRNYEQARPGAVFDGGYAFTDLTPGKYVVEVVPPTGYELYKEQDKNVDFGDVFGTAPVDVVVGALGALIVPDQAMVLAAQAPEPGLAQPRCVGPLHTVPGELSLLPGTPTYAPFAGADRPLCNMKEVILSDQGQSPADFHLFTSTPVAGQFKGLSTNDVALETNKASVQYGDKFGPAFMPVVMRDFKGHEIYRTYTDAFGRYNGLVPSTFSANLPIPSGYSPAMHVVCLNDASPIPGPNGTLLLDPRHDPKYGTLCVTQMYMPGTTTYLDTPILPSSAFAAGFDPVDCACTDKTPKIQVVNGPGGGPLAAAGQALTITFQSATTAVPNPAYEGPLATTPLNKQLTVTRDYSFGSGGTVSLVNSSGAATNLTINSINGSVVTATIPAGLASGAYQLVATRSDSGKSTINSVTVTVGSPLAATVKRVGSTQTYKTIQSAIDAATNGDLILVDAGIYDEMVVMNKPVRLQGAGASTIINAIKYPEQKVLDWRARVQGLVAGNPNYLVTGQPTGNDPIAGGLLGTEQGAAITVLAAQGWSNFSNSNAARIDGFTITGAEGGGGIYVNGHANNLVIANNYVTANSGLLHGGIRIGQPDLGLDQGNNWRIDVNNGVKIHHNAITLNGAQSDLALAGGLALATGSNSYQVTGNYICGNFSAGNAGGIGHFGLSRDGLIKGNQVVFNQTYNQALFTNGGGISISGESPAAGTVTLGTGDLTIDANLIQGNQAGTGHGGGIRTESVNGAEIEAGRAAWTVTLTNNMIVNNNAAYSGAGISMQDTVRGRVVNNTIANNDSTATVGTLIDLVSNTSDPQPAGIATERHSLALADVAGLPNNNGVFSNPTLVNNIVWHNRSFHYAVDQGIAVLMPVVNQAVIGECGANAVYWDLGVLGEPQVLATNSLRLSPQNSILTSLVGYGSSNRTGNPAFLKEYCNGSRALSAPGPMQIGAEVIEGGNFTEVRYGPLTQAYPEGSSPWNYHIGVVSAAVNAGLSRTDNNGVPSQDFDGEGRPQAAIDVGADEIPPPPPGQVTFSSGAFGDVVAGSTATRTITATVSVNPVMFGSTTNPTSQRFAITGNTCSGNTVAVGGTCTFTVTYSPLSTVTTNSSFTVSSTAVGSPNTVNLSGNGLPQVVFAAASAPGILSAGPLLDFGNLSGSVSSTVTIVVQGSASVILGPVTVSGVFNTRYTKGLDSCSGQTLSGGATCTVVVNFSAPQGNSLTLGSLSVNHNGVTTSPRVLGLSGR